MNKYTVTQKLLPSRRQGLRRRLLLCCVGVVSFLVLSDNAASAYCNNLPYLYAGISSSTNGYEGVERYVSVPASRLSNYNAEHIAFWLDVDDSNAPRNQCGGTGGNVCWVQAGHATGIGGNNVVQTHHVTYYETHSPTTGYSFTWFPGISLTQNDFYTVYFAGTHDSSGHPYYSAYVNTGSGNQFLGQNSASGSTAAGGNSETIQAQAEMSADSSINACPRVDVNNAYQYFGTNGSGGTSASTALYNSSNGSTWSEWTGSIIEYHQYEMNILRNHSAFDVRGGSD